MQDLYLSFGDIKAHLHGHQLIGNLCLRCLTEGLNNFETSESVFEILRKFYKCECQNFHL